MDKKKRYLFIVNVIISAAGVIFISAALGTEQWVNANPIRKVDDDVEDAAKNVSDGELGSKFKGKVNIGLFAGYKEIDYGFGNRKYGIVVECEAKENLCAFILDNPSESTTFQQSVVKCQQNLNVFNQLNDTASQEPPNHGMFSYSLWVCTIFFAVFTIAWGIVSIGFAAFNAGGRPIETISGPLGLYIWNGAAALSSLLCMVMYIVLYETDLSKNVMSPDDLRCDWTSDGLANLNYSFYFIVISTVLFISNIILLAVFRTECKLFSSRYSTSMTQKAADGVMMY